MRWVIFQIVQNKVTWGQFVKCAALSRACAVEFLKCPSCCFSLDGREGKQTSSGKSVLPLSLDMGSRPSLNYHSQPVMRLSSVVIHPSSLRGFSPRLNRPPRSWQNITWFYLWNSFRLDLPLAAGECCTTWPVVCGVRRHRVPVKGGLPQTHPHRLDGQHYTCNRRQQATAAVYRQGQIQWHSKHHLETNVEELRSQEEQHTA